MIDIFFLIWVSRSVPNIVRILIECGKVDLDSQTAVGETALDIAVALENKECASLLVHFGQCNVNLKVYSVINK